MATAAATGNDGSAGEKTRVPMDHKVHPGAIFGFLAVLAGGLAFAGYSIFTDTEAVGESLALGAFAFLGLALLIALGFEFVNGFHDTANAVATVIYTHSLKPVFAVVWSGCWNFIGVMTSSGAVAYSVITLLPVDLILQVGSAGGYAVDLRSPPLRDDPEQRQHPVQASPLASRRWPSVSPVRRGSISRRSRARARTAG